METDRTSELEKQLELRDFNITSLKKLIEQKDELLLVTNEKLQALEQKSTDFETALLNLTIDDPEAKEVDEVDTFVTLSSRAAQLEAENSDFRVKLALLSSFVQSFCGKYRNDGGDNIDSVRELEKCLSLIPTIAVSSERKSLNNEIVQLQVKLELEHERRIRTQAALDESEKMQVALKRELESKSKMCEDNEKFVQELKRKYELQMNKGADENRRLQKMLKIKEAQIIESEAKAKELSLRAEEFEELFNGQLASVKALQSDLAIASNENKALVKEMEALNHMFNAMERQYVNQAMTEYRSKQDQDEDSSNPIDSYGRELVVQDVLQAVEAKEAEVGLNLDESCFKEVTTRNGTRMVLSVSKTFMKLKDLILEKKTLEDQVEKMKAINTHLCSRVNRHEEKLFNITDELNKTWTFVSTLKQQHRQLHESEQILRAELSEKRQLLAKLREELEYSRESWNVVKKKTADSEREWRALRAEFASRRKLCRSAYRLGGGGGCSSGEEVSSESGFSTEDNHEELEEEAQSEPAADLMTASTITIKNDEPAAAEDFIATTKEEDKVGISDSIAILVPPLDFMAEVPPHLFPPLFPPATASNHNEEDDEQYSDLYQKLMASTARSAAIANRLAEMHRTNGSEEDEEDYEPATEEEEDQDPQGAVSPDIASEIAPEEELTDPPLNNESWENDEEDSDDSLQDLGLSPEAIEAALTASGRNFEDSDLDEDEDTASMSALDESEDSEAASELASFLATPGLAIPEPPPQPTFSLVPPPATVTVRPTFNYANMDSADSSDNEEDNQARSNNNEVASENATAVTRFLIKHLPKQLAKLRHDKAELEEKIRDLDTVISNQNVAMSEMERRIDVYKKEAETARKWSASLANLHHIKVNTTNLPPVVAVKDLPSPTTTTAALFEAVKAVEEVVELPLTVTKGNVRMIWKIASAASNTHGFVIFRGEATTSASYNSSGESTTTTYILSSIPLHPNDYSEIEVKAQKPGLYVLQLRATKLSLSDITYTLVIKEPLDSSSNTGNNEEDSPLL